MFRPLEAQWYIRRSNRATLAPILLLSWASLQARDRYTSLYAAELADNEAYYIVAGALWLAGFLLMWMWLAVVLGRWGCV